MPKKTAQNYIGIGLLPVRISAIMPMNNGEIIAAIAVPSIGTIREKARISATVADFRNFRTAFYTYSLMQNGYPPDSHNSLPAGVGMEVYLPASSFERDPRHRPGWGRERG